MGSNINPINPPTATVASTKGLNPARKLFWSGRINAKRPRINKRTAATNPEKSRSSVGTKDELGSV
jgi:hypothetical protein